MLRVLAMCTMTPILVRSLMVVLFIATTIFMRAKMVMYYQYTQGQGWEQKSIGGETRQTTPPANSNLDADRLARERGTDRMNNRQDQPNPIANRPNPDNHQFNRSNFSPRFGGHMGGFRMRR
jgi:hypothetical protein